MAHTFTRRITPFISFPGWRRYIFGFAGTLSAARAFCLIFGVVYLALGILGLVLGEPPDRMWHPLNVLELGTSDHAIHLLLGALFLAGGLFTKRV